MQNILVPTDYSGNAKNAVEYSIQLAKKAKAKLIFFHAYHVPLPNSKGILETPEKVGLKEIQKLKNYTAALRSKYNDIKMGFEVRPGFAVDEILGFLKQKKIDLIVMGTDGKTSVGDILIGSVVTNVIKKSPVPILVIPENVKYNEIKKIALAYDYSEIKNLHVLDTLKAITEMFKAEVLVVNILRSEKSLLKKTGSSNMLESFLSKIKHSFHFPINKSIVEGINNFVDNTGVDLSAVIPHKHKVLHRLFHKSNVKRIALHPHVPLLVLPG